MEGTEVTWCYMIKKDTFKEMVFKQKREVIVGMNHAVAQELSGQQ